MGEADGDQGELEREEREPGVVAGLHREEKRAGDERQDGAEGGHGAEEAQDGVEADVGAPEAHEAEVHGHDRADEERDAEDVRGVDRRVGPAGAPEQRRELARLDGGGEFLQPQLRSG